MNYQIREVLLSDEVSLRFFFEEVISHTIEKEGIVDFVDDIGDEIEDKMEKFSLALRENTRFRFFVAIKEETIIGTVSINELGDFAKQHIDVDPKKVLEIGSVYVKPDYQSLGVGKKLLTHALVILKQGGCQYYLLDSGYIRAQKTWWHLLGEPYKILKDFWGNGYDHMFWYKEL